MYRVLTNTPFGFVVELKNEDCYFSSFGYQLFVNDEYYGDFKQNVISVFGLKPDTDYEIRLQKEAESAEAIQFSVRTRDITYLINIYDYNATGNGETDDTSAINTAIYTAPEGSVVYIPAGTYLVNQIYLKSGVDIYMEKGSHIKQNTDRRALGVLKGYQKDYHHREATVNASWEGNPLDTYCSVFYGKDVQDIQLYGEGIIDGNGDIGGWWINQKVKNVAYRPKNVFLDSCRNITVSGITSRNSASWNIHPFYCEDVSFYALKIESDPTSPNTDGLNPESCEHVEIIGCLFDVGDDCIAVKSGKYFMSQEYYRPCRDILVQNCYMGKGHGGIAVGSEISGGVEDLYVTRCLMEGTDRGVRVKTRRGRGSRSVLKNIRFSNIEMNEVVHCFAVNMFYNCDPDGLSSYVSSKEMLPVDEGTPQISNIDIHRIQAADIRGCGIFMYGLPESKIDRVSVRESCFSFAGQRTSEPPEMLDDFQCPENIGLFMKNTTHINLSDNAFAGEYVTVMDNEM